MNAKHLQRICIRFLFLITCFYRLHAIGADSAPGVDPVIFTFSTVGDSRYDRKETDVTAQDKIWQQNTRALSRILREIEAAKPAALFFNGDMIMGYKTNASILDPEYAYWRGMVANLMETGTYVVPIPGNHEMQIKIKNQPKEGKAASSEEDVLKVAQPVCGDIWRHNMGDLILETNLWFKLVGAPVEAWDVTNAPSIGGSDGITTDQTQLTYSFDCKHIHFSIINTDAVGKDSHAPVHWLEQDFAAAKLRGCTRFFVFGHKMAFTYQFNPSFGIKGLDQFPDNLQAFWKVVTDYKATYFCGHEHLFHAMQPVRTEGNDPWQIIVGSGGSPFEAKPGMSSNPNDRKYAWANVDVHASGLVNVVIRGFDEHYGPTETIQTIEIH